MLHARGCQKYTKRAAELNHSTQQVLHHPELDPSEADYDVCDRPMGAIEASGIEIIASDLSRWKDRDSNQGLIGNY